MPGLLRLASNDRLKFHGHNVRRSVSQISSVTKKSRFQEHSRIHAFRIDRSLITPKLKTS